MSEARVRDEGGDDACWLGQVCDRCGGIIDPHEPHVCRRPDDDVPCGADVHE